MDGSPKLGRLSGSSSNRRRIHVCPYGRRCVCRHGLYVRVRPGKPTSSTPAHDNDLLGEPSRLVGAARELRQDDRHGGAGPRRQKGSIDVAIDATHGDLEERAREKDSSRARTTSTPRGFPPSPSSPPNLKFDGDRVVAADGELTMRGVTKPSHAVRGRFKCATRR